MSIRNGPSSGLAGAEAICLPCAGSVFLVAQDPVAIAAELARLRAENARLLKLLRLSPQQGGGREGARERGSEGGRLPIPAP